MPFLSLVNGSFTGNEGTCALPPPQNPVHPARTIQPFTFACTICAATPRIRVVESLVLHLRKLPSGWKEGFEGISQTGQPVAPDLPAADLLVPRSAFPADG